MNKFKTFFIILISFLALAIGGFFAWQKFSTQNQETRSLDRQKTQDKTADWKNFSVSGPRGFQFKYPPYYEIDSGMQRHEFSDPEDVNNMRFSLSFYNININDVSGKRFKSFSPNVISIGGREVVYYSLGEHNQLVKTYFISLQELSTIEITTIITEYGSSPFEDQLKLFDQILSTFRFLE